MTDSIVHVDSRKRVSLAKYVKPAQHYRVEVFEGGIIQLTPVTVYTRSELAAEVGKEVADGVFADAALADKHLTARQHPERFTPADDSALIQERV